MDSITNDLTSVHEALNAASQETKKPPMIVSSFKIDEETKNLAQQICRQNGTDLSAFLRHCCIALVNDYR